MNGIMKRIDQLDEELHESMQGRCDYTTDDEVCIASATRLLVATREDATVAGLPVCVEILTCDDHGDELRDTFEPIDSEHAFEHRCAPVYGTDRGDVVVFSCDCGRTVGVE